MQGYAVVGINVRQYLSSFTSRTGHVTTDQVPRDYAAIAQLLRDRHTLWEPVVVAGVSEGAALAVVAGADPANHAWVKGVLTMGLPPSAELAWRWTDITSWITKKDAAEPSFEPHAVHRRHLPDPVMDDPLDQGRVRDGGGLPSLRTRGGRAEAARADRCVQSPVHRPAAGASSAGACWSRVDAEPDLTRRVSDGVRTRVQPPATSAAT